MMKKLLLTLVLVAMSSVTFAQITPQWIRYQTISPDGNNIVFTYMGDLYRVAASGGDAVQLTFHEAHDYMPVWSPDGSKIAFASDRYGNFDVYVMDAMGGPATRVTFHSNDESPYTFSADGNSIVFGAQRMDTAEHRQFPTGSQPELYSVSTTGGRVAQIFTIPAEFVQTNRDGSKMIYHDKKGGENEWRKHHRSDITRDIWMYDAASNTHTMITNWLGEDRQPVFSQDEQTVYFLSEESGTFNVHKMPVSNPSQRTQVTSFETHPVRFLSQGNGVLAFGYDGELYTMRDGQEPRKVEVRIRTQDKANSDSFISINGGVQEMAISPDGKEIAFVARGEVFVTSVDGAMTKRITNTPERERFVTFTPDGKGVVYASERDGRWSIFKTEKVRSEEPFFYASTLLNETGVVQNQEDNYLPEYSPDGKKLAFIAGRRTLRVLDLASGNTVDLLTPDDLFHMGDGDKYFTWSPDSRWLLTDWRSRLSNSDVLLLAADGSQRINLTESGFDEMRPKWVMGGMQMLWFSNRDGLRSYATSGQTERDVYSMFFTQDGWDTFNLSEDEFKLKKELDKLNEKKEDKDDKKEETKETPALQFDLDGVKDRKARLTIHSSSLSDATLSKDGEKLYYLTSFEGNYNLWETELRTRDTKQLIRLNTGGGSLMWDKNMENLYLLSRGSISKLNLSGGSSSGIRIAGEMTYDAHKERVEAFEHVYIRTKNIFYEPTFHGIDWDFMAEEYRKFLPHIGNSYEFSEMLSELLGELNVSHSGARYSTSIDNADATASLGIFFDYGYTGNGIKITEVIKGGPLDKASMNITAGMVIEKIDGETVTPDRDIASYLNRKSGNFVLLDVVSADGRSRQQVTVKPISLGAERGLLYQRYIRINEAEVNRLSNGRLGYVHIPGMGDGPFRDVIDAMLGKYYDRESMVVDARFNGGGDLVADLAMFFTGEKFNTYATAAKDVGGEPTARWTKPTVTLFNESMYSDGHCYAAAYNELQLGTSIGMPVPGTCSFAGWEGLPDGTRWGVVPVSARNYHNEWMENNQTEPNVKVKNMPGLIGSGRDEQLERAVQVAIQNLED
jgi:Tol biopolymer transport system component/C-terminal processing protease CtpA/Prc